MAKISNLIEKKYYDDIIASIIVNQGKNLFEAELDLLELIDFVNFNIEYFYIRLINIFKFYKLKFLKFPKTSISN